MVFSFYHQIDRVFRCKFSHHPILWVDGWWKWNLNPIPKSPTNCNKLFRSTGQSYVTQTVQGTIWWVDDGLIKWLMVNGWWFIDEVWSKIIVMLDVFSHDHDLMFKISCSEFLLIQTVKSNFCWIRFIVIYSDPVIEDGDRPCDVLETIWVTSSWHNEEHRASEKIIRPSHKCTSSNLAMVYRM